jgi:serine/threonine protein kinase/formylglycine-generating enzyme required for sulfatase activity
MSSAPDRSALAQDIAARARTLAGKERDEFVKRACRDDAALQSEVAALLGASDGAEPVTVVSHGEPGTSQDSLREMLGRVSARPPERSRYRMEGEIARGGMGAILRVWDQDLNRPLAMKVALDQGSLASSTAGADHEAATHDPRALARFLEEAQVTGQLDHPGIVPVHELGVDAQGRIYFTMKLVKGVTLRSVFDELFKGSGQWTQTRVLGLLLKVCEAMSYAHSKGVIHRDLKPANIMVGRYGEVYVMDWGLARVMTKEERRDLRLDLERAGLSQAELTSVVSTELKRLREASPDEVLMTMDGTVVGTPYYMPPEQALTDTSGLGPRTDVYSLGAILYHLLTGTLPYVPRGKKLNQFVVLNMLIHGPPTPVRQLAPDAPEELVAICEKAMAHELNDRYVSAVELAADIQAYLEHRPVSARRHSLREVARLAYERNRPIVLTAAAGAALLFTAIAVSMWQLRREVTRTKTANEQLKTANADLNTSNKERERNAALLTSRALVAEADELAITPAGLPRMRTWIERVHDLLDREPTLREEKDRQAGETPLGIEIRQALGRLDTLRTVLPRVEGWEQAAASLEGRLSGEDAASWSKARESIANSPKYGGLQLAPQVGLVPLRVNPASGLWEFWHVASGARPEVDPLREDCYWMKPESGIVLVLVPKGIFTMGDERMPILRQTLPNSPMAALFMGKYEVTQGQWIRIMGRNDAHYSAGLTIPLQKDPKDFTPPSYEPMLITETHPIELVDWFAADRFCTRLGLTLPKESQWEYSCRAGTTTLWTWGDEESALKGTENVRDLSAKDLIGREQGGWSEWDDGFPAHAPVGSFEGNDFGLFDMHGNVAEWCLNPPLPEHWLTATHVIRYYRGGSWEQPAKFWSCSAFRVDREASEVFDYVGLRAARLIDP